MLLPSIVGAVGLLGTVAEAAPRGSWFGRVQPRVALSANDYTPPKYIPIKSYMPPQNTTTLINSTTLEPTIQCPTNYVFVSTRTVDVTVTVTASSDGAHYTTEICKDCTKTVTISNTVLVPPTKYASTLPYGSENTGSPYHPANSTYAAPSQTKTGNDYPHINSTIGYSFTTPIDQHASPTYQTPGQSAVYSSPDGQISPPVYTKPANTKPVYSDPAYGNSTGTQSGYVPPVYTKPAYSSLASGNGTVPVYTKPVDTPIYSAPVYTKPVLPGNTSVVTPPIYTKPAETPVYSVPVYTKPVETPIYTPPVYTKPAYPGPVIPGNSSTVEPPVISLTTDNAIYTPPVYTKPVEPPVYSVSVIPSNSSTIEPIIPTPTGSATSETSASLSTSAYVDPIYTPPVYNPPVISSEPSEYSTISIATNSTIPPVIPITSEDPIIVLTTDSTTSSETETSSAETTSLDVTSSQAPPVIPTPSTTEIFTSTTETSETTITETTADTATTSPTVTPFQPTPTPAAFSYEQPRQGGLAAAIRLGLGLGA
ncbi:hypothetical protein FGSG_00411 [Fusarium graminearum PH-1]|uniref:Chromosome 1, complete genome n=1 Tax=Gibberella zeae (strain ATCC MYA-4620 / CBS 123657 / FGSC 9075 / NRRL 31084 / PH-1) TaxID=229533 RepID=I1RA84_GIBZE|nr:hypothetical protein FGSG_00411 [Fusarium graminearum PH-1]EYB30715.1 hypothetical protein FG05_00411 [Fusarium graminearum]ESU05592.1 hypothetical protein FGSG_00411 [Fusarium graminearum PH-1]CAF3577315.1 unnamed protein product [Fusarium graminearum]CAF3604495.1 unnamed protein product [Fusarium graminearum]CEF72339.1 unnamed protein product [Fusarium graminearum]|eukprot:XP_011316077.1 hypothetical protein FGSG_00411 [Fusarium graminearum PH-1]